MSKKLVIATRNAGKITEFRRIVDAISEGAIELIGIESKIIREERLTIIPYSSIFKFLLMYRLNIKFNILLEFIRFNSNIII